MLPIVIAGATGRMGRVLLESTLAHPDCNLVGATVRPGSAWAGHSCASLVGPEAVNAPIVDAISEFALERPVVIDFTTPESTRSLVGFCREHDMAMVIGTTGLSADDEAFLAESARHIPIVYAPNFSVGVNLVLELLKTTARVLGDTVDIEVIEAHHRHKVDAPSGTALAMGRVIAETLDRTLEADAVYGREGRTGARPRTQIGFSTIRGGDIVGDHTVLFAAEGERVEITHKASSRKTFADGAVRAAIWAFSQRPGLYSMVDVLGLRVSV
ncbi:MAG: 4-hydroxy-tetrahydrodipicolinate reductase [Litorivicinaceae bacterium]